jgi:hypothetical protein
MVDGPVNDPDADLARLAQRDQDRADARTAAEDLAEVLACFHTRLRDRAVSADLAKQLTRRHQSYLYGWMPAPDDE